MTKESLIEDMNRITRLITYSEKYPNGAIKIGLYYYKPKALVDALKDIKIRRTVDGTTKADKMLLEILSGLIIPD